LHHFFLVVQQLESVLIRTRYKVVVVEYSWRLDFRYFTNAVNVEPKVELNALLNIQRVNIDFVKLHIDPQVAEIRLCKLFN